MRYVKLRRHFIRLPVDLLIRQRFDVAEEDITFRDGACIERCIGHGKSHGVNRMGQQGSRRHRDAAHRFLVQQHGAGRRLAQFLHAALDADKVILFQIRAVKAKWRNEEAAVGQADGIGAVRGGKQPILYER